jgi:hypothetical protein
LLFEKTMNATESNNGTGEQGGAESWLEMVRRQVGSLDFGVVQIVVHAARVVQIERTEKIRLEIPLRPQNEGTSFARQSAGGRRSKNG